VSSVPGALFLSDSAQGLFTLEGNTSRRAYGKLREETRTSLARPLALALCFIKATMPTRDSDRTLAALRGGHAVILLKLSSAIGQSIAIDSKRVKQCAESSVIPVG